MRARRQDWHGSARSSAATATARVSSGSTAWWRKQATAVSRIRSAGKRGRAAHGSLGLARGEGGCGRTGHEEEEPARRLRRRREARPVPLRLAPVVRDVSDLGRRPRRPDERAHRRRCPRDRRTCASASRAGLRCPRLVPMATVVASSNAGQDGERERRAKKELRSWAAPRVGRQCCHRVGRWRGQCGRGSGPLSLNSQAGCATRSTPPQHART